MFGKMSTGMRRNARYASNARLRLATKIVTGRRRDRWRSHMVVGPSIPSLGFNLVEERFQIAAHLGRREQRPPHPEPRHGIVGFRLRQQSLRLSHLGDAGEATVIPRAGPAFGV